MRFLDEQITTLYAKAYLDVYGSLMTTKDAQALNNFYTYCTAHPILATYLSIPILKKQYIEFVTRAAALFNLPNSWIQLGMLLEKNNRLKYLPAVSLDIAHRFTEKNNILECVIETARPLEPQQLKEAIRFFEQITHKKVRYTIALNPQLIAGMRIQSSTIRWEESVQKRLRAVAELTM